MHFYTNSFSVNYFFIGAPARSLANLAGSVYWGSMASNRTEANFTEDLVILLSFIHF